MQKLLFSTLHNNCSSAAPKPWRDASHLMRVSSVGLKWVFSVAFAITVLICSKCNWWFSFQINFSFFFNKGRRGWHILARLGINLLRWWTLPKNDRNCFNVFGALISAIAAVLDSIGLTPLCENVKPSQFIWCFAKWHLLKLILRLSASSFWRHLYTYLRCDSWVPLLTTIMSSRKHYVLVSPTNV